MTKKQQHLMQPMFSCIETSNEAILKKDVCLEMLPGSF